MKKINLLFVLLFVLRVSIPPVFAQNTEGTVIDYMPAPGQHINIENIGTPQAALKITEDYSSLVSLGSFGGYIVVKFKNACVNHPQNPFGIDFTIFGNAFSGSSEPGVVWVMKDSNHNGIPDDDWYEIAGSSHFFPETVRKYEVTYTKTTTRDIVWKDNLGKSGTISANEFNLQEYYPSSGFFPSYPRDSVSFTGTLLQNDIVVKSGSGEIRIYSPCFGYADSHSQVREVDLSLPDNPYTKEKEGAGGDPIDISWATDSSGQYVELDSIHFVKIVSASLNDTGWLGEVSTDVAWVQTVQPQPDVTGKETLLVYSQYPSKVILGDSIVLSAFYFERGRITNEQVSFQSMNDEVASVDGSGLLRAHATGETQIRFSAREETEFTSIKVVVPESIRFVTDFSALYPGDTLELNAEIYDNDMEPVDLGLHFSSSRPSAGKVITDEGKSYFVALQPGEIILTAYLDAFHLDEAVTVKIHSFDQKLNVLLSIKTTDDNLLPLQPVDVGLADLNGFIENRRHDYAGLGKVTLFHALAAGLQKAGAPFKFRDDEAAGGNLYLYMVENDGLFFYGWGGKTNSAIYTRAWVARVNGNQYVNDFDNILLSDGDTVVLYHVSDVLSEWIFIRMLSDKLSVVAGESIEILVEQTSCTFRDGEILESGFIPVQNVPINAGNIWYTGATGKVKVIPEGSFPLTVSSGSDALLLTETIAVGANLPSYTFVLYPNPVENRLFIVGKSVGNNYGNKVMVKIVDSTGRIVVNKNLTIGPFHLDLSFLVSGRYQLIIGQGRQSEIHKLIKR